MDGSQRLSYEAHLRAIRSAIVALALAVVAAPFLLEQETLGLLLLVGTLVAIAYSFVPTLLES